VVKHFFVIAFVCLGSVIAGAARAHANKLPSHAQKLPRKVAVTSRPQIFEPQFVQIGIFHSTANALIKNVPAIPISSNTAALRLSEIEIEELGSGYRLYLSGRSELRWLDADLAKKWFLVQASTTFAFRGIPTALAPQHKDEFGYSTAAEMNEDWQSVREIFQMSRRPASAASTVLETELQRLGDKMLTPLLESQQRMQVDRYVFGPLASSLKCHTESYKVDSESLQKEILRSSSVLCEATTGAHISKGLKQMVRFHAGFVDARNAQGFVDPSEVLSELGRAEFANVTDKAKEISFSSPTQCTKAHISDSGFDVEHCTRTFRGFPSLQDTVVVIGKPLRGRLITNVVRMSGLTRESTRLILQNILDTMERN
jgi:hypothetical protein